MLAALMASANNKYLLRQLKGSSKQPLLLFASGSLMYGNSHSAHNENSPLKPISYARQYYKGEIPIHCAANDDTYPVCFIRMPWLLGPGSWFNWFFLDNLKKANAIPAFWNQDNFMEILDVRDAATLMVQYAELNLKGTYNLPGAERMKQVEFINLISEVFELPAKPYTELYRHKIEHAVIEAFTSNILIETNYPEVIKNYKFCVQAYSLISF